MDLDNLIKIEQELCVTKGIDFSQYEKFFKEKFPDFNEKNLNDYEDESSCANYKVNLFNYGLAINYLSGDNPLGKPLNLEFNNTDKNHMLLCIDLIRNSANKFICFVLLKEKFIIFNDQGICRISTGKYTAILKRIF